MSKLPVTTENRAENNPGLGSQIMHLSVFYGMGGQATREKTVPCG
jgi:hypothetical protein